MRILIVTPWFPTASSPASGRFVEREAAALAEAHDVTVLHLDWQGSTGPGLHDDAPYASSRIPLSRANPFDFARARRAVAQAASTADIVHSHALTVLLPWGRARLTDRPWVHSEHWSGLTAPESLTVAERIVRRRLLFALSGPDIVVAESTRLADAVRAHRTGSTVIVPCIVPPVSVKDAPADDHLRLVAVGGLIPRKGPLLAVEALAHLVRAGHPGTLTWVGDGPERDAVLASASALDVADNVFLTGVLDDAGVSAALDAANVFILPTQGDNFCVVAAEALSHGRPIVSGSETGAVDYADPRVSAFVAEQSGHAYAQAVLAVRESARLLSAEEVAATVRDRFTPAAVVARLTDVYAEASHAAESRARQRTG